MTQGFQTTIAKGFLVWGDSKERCVHCNEPIVPTFGRHSCVAPVQRRFALCTSCKVSEVTQRSTSTRLAFPATKNNSAEIAHKKFTIDIPSINPPRKLMEEYWFLAPMSRLAISLASLNIFSEISHCTGQATKPIDEENYFM